MSFGQMVGQIRIAHRISDCEGFRRSVERRNCRVQNAPSARNPFGISGISPINSTVLFAAARGTATGHRRSLCAAIELTSEKRARATDNTGTSRNV